MQTLTIVLLQRTLAMPARRGREPHLGSDREVQDHHPSPLATSLDGPCSKPPANGPSLSWG